MKQTIEKASRKAAAYAALVEGRIAKLVARLVATESGGGSEVVQTVIVLGFALGLGAALLLLQGNIQTVLKDAGTSLTTFFQSITAGMS